MQLTTSRSRRSTNRSRSCPPPRYVWCNLGVAGWVWLAIGVSVVGIGLIAVGVWVGSGASNSRRHQLVASLASDAGVALVTGAVVGVVIFLATDSLSATSSMLKKPSRRIASNATFAVTTFGSFERWRHKLVPRPSPFAGLDLREGHLAGLDLSEADLTGADLTDVHLVEADLTGAKLNDAILEDLTSDDDTVWSEGFEPPSGSRRHG
jgi:hypothetical protein